MAVGIFQGTGKDWYPKQDPIVPKPYHKYLKEDDLKISYPEIYGDKVIDPKTGEERDKTLQEIIDAVSNGSTVRLSKDYTEDIVIKSGKVVKIDLAGHKLTNKTEDTITIELGGGLTLTGKGLVDNTINGKAPVYNNGITIIDGASITKSETDYYAILNHGTMVITGDAKVYLPEKVVSSVIDNGYYDYTKTDPKLGYVVGKNIAFPTITIESGTFSGGRNAIKNDDGGIAVIEGGTFTAEQCGLFNVNKMTVKDCTVVPMSDANGQHTVYAEGWKYAVYTKYYNDDTDAGRIDITGGDFAGLLFEDGAPKAAITVTGGTFDRESPILDETKQHWEKKNGKYIVVAGPTADETKEEEKPAEEETDKTTDATATEDTTTTDAPAQA